jgi:hypothetical protein
VFNLFNQRAVTYINQNLIRTSFIQPAGGSSTPSGIDYKSLLSGYDYIAQANTEPYISPNSAASPGTTTNILNSSYGLPYGWQDGRSIRLKIRFAF